MRQCNQPCPTYRWNLDMDMSPRPRPFASSQQACKARVETSLFPTSIPGSLDCRTLAYWGFWGVLLLLKNEVSLEFITRRFCMRLTLRRVRGPSSLAHIPMDLLVKEEHAPTALAHLLFPFAFHVQSDLVGSWASCKGGAYNAHRK